MTDAPERIWAATFFQHSLRATDQKPIEDVVDICGYQEYIRADLVKPEDVLDAASTYLIRVYGIGALSNPVDRSRILSALEDTWTP